MRKVGRTCLYKSPHIDDLRFRGVRYILQNEVAVFSRIFYVYAGGSLSIILAPGPETSTLNINQVSKEAL